MGVRPTEDPSAPGSEPPGVARFPHLFSPLKIGEATLRNRIVLSAHDTTLAVDGRVSDALVAYHEACAAGGVGMIVVEVAGVNESARYTSHVLMANDDGCLPGYRRLADACHAHGSVVLGQIFHPGREVMESQDGSAPVAYSVSAVPTERFHVMPRPLGRTEVERVVADYAGAAGRLVRAGLDGVEVVASHGYLPAQFLNPRLNDREDEYGREPVRFLREVVAAAREAVGAAAIVGLRISVDELSHDGLQPDEAVAAIGSLAAGGMLSYVNVTAGSSATLAGSDHIVPPMNFENAYVAPLAARVRSIVDIPVIVAGRINEPQQAERVLAAGQADACAMARALISDPELPRKAIDGRLDAIRACVACNQACIGHFHRGYPTSCIQHPERGRELEFGSLEPASRPRRVLVAGAGPAGLKAAAVAAARGHDVTIHEAGRQVGGQVLLAERLPGRAEFGGVATNLRYEAESAGARIVLDSRVDRSLVEREQPDVVVVATGGLPRRPPLEILGSPTVLDAWELLRGAELPDGHVVVADWPCDWVGPGLALHASSTRSPVTLAVNGYMPGQRIQQYVRDALIADLHRRHVTIIPMARLYGADDDTVYFEHTVSGEPIIVEGAASLVLAQGQVANDSLAAALAAAGTESVLVGDCLAPRTVEEAVLEGLRAATTL
ncbi:MAG: oxidoreductase [Acidobacteria bacterium]|nr:MAG: oxidoreductase [Acidobacteriota bacterium]GIK76407.1 MAG: oxidoreductase [Actinomycetes bacterium]